MTESIMDLLKNGRYDMCLRLAEQTLMRSALSTEDLARLQAVICRCRVQTGDYLGALSAGQVADRLSRDVDSLTDVRGQVLLDLTEILLYLGRYRESLEYGELLLSSPAYADDTELLARCWCNMGVNHLRSGNPEEAVNSFQMARRLLAPENGSGHSWARSYLVKAHIRAGDLMPIPALLEEGERYVRMHPEHLEAKVAHLCDAAEFQYAQGHAQASIDLIELALDMAAPFSWHRYQCRMLLGRIATSQARFEEALRHIMTARAIAISGKHYDLESEAAESMYGLLKEHPEAVTGESARDRTARRYQQGGDSARPLN